MRREKNKRRRNKRIFDSFAVRATLSNDNVPFRALDAPDGVRLLEKGTVRRCFTRRKPIFLYRGKRRRLYERDERYEDKR